MGFISHFHHFHPFNIYALFFYKLRYYAVQYLSSTIVEHYYSHMNLFYRYLALLLLSIFVLSQSQNTTLNQQQKQTPPKNNQNNTQKPPEPKKNQTQVKDPPPKPESNSSSPKTPNTPNTTQPLPEKKEEKQNQNNQSTNQKPNPKPDTPVQPKKEEPKKNQQKPQTPKPNEQKPQPQPQPQPPSPPKPQPQPQPKNPELDNAQQLKLFSPQEVKLEASKNKLYKFKVQSPKPAGDLYFIAESKNFDPEQTPTLTVKLGTKQFSCITKATDVLCFVPASEFKQNDLFSIRVTCSSNCTAIVEAYINSEMQLKMGESTQIEFHMNAAGVVVNSQVPKDIGDFKEIVISAYVQNPYQITEGFKMKAATGANLQSKDVEYKYNSVNLWSDGQGIYLKNTQVKAGDSIKIIIDGPKGLKLNLQIYYKTNNSVIMNLGQYVFDEVQNQTKYYYVDISGVPDANKSTLYIKLNRYAGPSNLTVYKDQTKTQTVSLGTQQFGTNQYFLTPQERKVSKLQDKFFIGVQSNFIATFRISVQLDNKGYTEINNNQPQFGIIQKEEVDNFIYRTERTYSQNNDVTMRLRIKIFEGQMNFAIKRCESTSENVNSCIYNKSSEVKDTDFKQILGTYHNYSNSNVTQFTFNYDVSKCPKAQGVMNRHKCTFLIVFITQNRTRYEFVLSESVNQYKMLEQSIPFRDRLSQLTYNYYRFSLSSSEDVVGVDFFLSTISGDCILLGSVIDQFPELPKDSRFDDPNVVTHMYYLKFNQTKDAYYLSVFAYDESYYTITAVVTRKNQKNQTIVSELQLLESIPSINYIEQGQKQMKFYITGFTGESLFVDIEQIEGYVWFQIDKADKDWNIVQNSNWKSSDGWIQVPQSAASTPTNYIISVKSSQAVFSIQYTKKGGCIVYRFSKPIHVMLSPNITRCYSYEINDIDDIEIATSIGNYDGGINNVNLTVDINGTRFKLNDSSETISATKWIEYCPNLRKDTMQNRTTCFLNIYASSYVNIYFTLVAQYEKQQILLVDGVYQRVQAQMSSKTPRHYYFTVEWESTITLFLKSFTDTNYVVNARIVSWREYLTMPEYSVYPLYNFNNDIRSQTSALKTTSLIINKATLEKYNCNYNCVLLISVFTKSQKQQHVHFDIEASQMRGFLFPGDAKLGFVEAGATDNYDIKTSQVSQKTRLTLKIQPFTQNCAITTIRYRIQNKQQYEAEGIELVNNTYVIPAHEDDRIYTVEVDTKTTCSYQISLLASNGYVTLIPGVSFDALYTKSQNDYYLYYHRIDSNINIMAMAQYGTLDIEATPLSPAQLSNLSQLVESGKFKKKYRGSSSTGSLIIKSTDQDYCKQCYYLISIFAISKSSADLIVYPQDSPVQIRNNRIINQKILAEGSKKVYRFHSTKTFYISVDVSVGEATVKVVRKVDGKILYNSYVSGTRFITVKTNASLQALKDNQKLGWDIYGQVYAYQITISPKVEKMAVAYTFVIKYQNDPLRLRQGIPSTIHPSDKNKCVSFSSMKTVKNGYIIISMLDTNNFSYSLNCKTTDDDGKTIDCENGSNILVKQTRNPQNINSEIRMYDGIYSFCVNMPKAKTFTILFTKTNLIHIQPDKQLLIQQIKTTQSFNIYNPNLENVMIELFECKGRVGLMTTSNYTQLDKTNNPQNKIVVERSKVAGHYISTYEPYHSDPVDEIFTSVIPQLNAKVGIKNLTYILKYSHYMNDNPYKSIEPDNLDVTYDLTETALIFRVERIVNYGEYSSKTKNNYTLFIADNLQRLNGVANCELEEAQHSDSRLFDSDPQKDDQVEFYIPIDTIKQKFGSKYFYATVKAKVGATGFSKSAHSHSYKIIYNSVQINPNYRTIMDKSSSQLKSIFIWIVIPSLIGIIALVIACRYCLRGWMYNPVTDAAHLIEENVDSSIQTKKNSEHQNPSTGTLLVNADESNPSHSNIISQEI